MAAKVIDLTHDVVPEVNWKPIRKEMNRESLPPAPLLSDRVLLREWEMEQLCENHQYYYDKRIVEDEVFQGFKAQGDIINMLEDPEELDKDQAFWEKEQEIHQLAFMHIDRMRQFRPYDSFDI